MGAAVGVVVGAAEGGFETVGVQVKLFVGVCDGRGVGGGGTVGPAVGCFITSPSETQRWSWNGGLISENESPSSSTKVNNISDSWSPPSTTSS